MPELPEVETIRRQLEPWLVGREVLSAGSHPSEKFLPARDTIGAVFEQVNRRGKFLLISLDDDSELIIHLGMTGQLRPFSDISDPYLRAWWQLDDGRILGFRDVRRFGRIRIAHDGIYEGLLSSLGPEPLAEEFTANHLYTQIKKSSRRLKTQLLSQKPVAGVGNIYADEACFRANLYPGVRKITVKQAENLHLAIRNVLSEGLAHGGTTLRDYVNVDGEQGGFQNYLQCYGRAGEPCIICGELLRKVILDGRGTTYCQLCQRR